MIETITSKTFNNKWKNTYLLYFQNMHNELIVHRKIYTPTQIVT